MSPRHINHSRFNNLDNWERPFDHLKRKGVFTLTSYDFCISTAILKLEMTIFGIYNMLLNETIHNMIQSPVPNIPSSLLYLCQ